MCSLKLLFSLETPCHKRFHLNPKAAISCPEISALICKTILTLNELCFQYISLYAKFTNIRS